MVHTTRVAILKGHRSNFFWNRKEFPNFLLEKRRSIGIHASFLLVKNFQKNLTPNGSGGSNFCLWPKSYIIKAKRLQKSELRMMEGILEWNEELNLQVPKVLGGSWSGRTARRRSENQRKIIYIKIGLSSRKFLTSKLGPVVYGSTYLQ